MAVLCNSNEIKQEKVRNVIPGKILVISISQDHLVISNLFLNIKSSSCNVLTGIEGIVYFSLK